MTVLGWIMKYYLIAELEITDQSWVSDYLKNVTGMVERHGGRYLARTPKVERIEGERKAAGIFVVESAMAFYESAEYRPYRQKRIAGARNEFFLVAGEDIAKAARAAD